MIRCVRKCYFTLLEVLVVLTIISLGAALTGVKINEMYHQQRFLSDTQLVLSQLTMAQDLMLIMDTDVKVNFERDAQTRGYFVWLDVEKPVKDSWARLVERKLPLSSIHSITFNDRTENPLTLKFTFGSMSSGTLVLAEDSSKNYQESDEGKFKITLPGYPRPFERTVKDRRERDLKLFSQALYPKDVYERLYADPSKTNEK